MENLNLEFLTDKDLYQSYMPFLKNGGLFVQTTDRFELGADVFLQVSLPDSLEASKIKGQVCWLTPVGAQNGTPACIGINFVEDPEQVRNQIEKAIGRLLSSSDPTLTM